MKKHPFALLIFLLLVFHLPANDFNDIKTLKDAGLNGKVKSCTIEEYQTKVGKNGEIVKGELKDSTVYLFNSFGYLIEKASYGVDKMIPKSRSVFAFQKDTLCSVMKNYFGEKLVDTVHYSFDNGLLSSEEDFPFGRLGDKNILKYYGYSGNLLSRYFTLKENGDTNVEVLFFYDKSNRKTEMRQFVNLGSPTLSPFATINYSYNAKGQLSNQTEDNVFQKTKKETSFGYDDRGSKNMISEVTPQNTTTDTYNYTYDDHGNWVKCTGGEIVKKSTGEIISKNNSDWVERIIEYAK